MAAEPIPIRQVVTSNYYAHGYQAIYAISPADDSRIVYVGISTTAAEGVAQRILDHCSGGTCSSVRDTLGLSRAAFQSHLIRILEVPDPRFRSRLEHYTIAALDPDANRWTAIRRARSPRSTPSHKATRTPNQSLQPTAGRPDV